jgi:hypothetical protein
VSRKDTSVNLAVNPVAVLLVKFMEGLNSWTGTCTKLLAELTRLRGDDAKYQEGWPADPIRLSKVLHDLVPVMRTHGFELEFPKRKRDGRSVHIQRMDPLDEPCDESADPAEECTPPSSDNRERFEI